ncbi:MAG: hypothetical protein ACPGJV_08230 [Bacteriovoracaceae bacterium]
MKKQILIATGLAVLSTSAYATKARLEALGQDTTDGSLWIADSYNKFRNAAHVNMYKNYVVTEWGTEDQAGGNEEKLEGGYFRESGSFSYGVYFNRENSEQDTIAQTGIDNVTIGSAGYTFTGHDVEGFKEAENGIDLFFGGDMGVQWGARIHYAKSENGITRAAATNANNEKYNQEHSALGLGLGMVMGDLQAYANIDFKNEYTGTDNVDTDSKSDTMEADTGINLGVSYALGDIAIAVDYDKEGADLKDQSDTTVSTENYEKSAITVAVGHTHEVSSTARVYSSIAYSSISYESNFDSSGELKAQEIKASSLPLMIGFEADANSWLTLRGSVTQDFIISTDEFSDASTENAADTNDEDKGSASTTMAAGATLNFGKLKVDGIISNTLGSDANTSESDLTTDNLMSKVSVHYWF